MALDFGSHTDSESENTEMDFNLTKDVLEITAEQLYSSCWSSG